MSSMRLDIKHVSALVLLSYHFNDTFFQQLEDKEQEVVALTDKTARLQQLCDGRAETNRQLNEDLTTQYNKVSIYS